MTEKPLSDLKTFVDSVNKKEKKANGNKVRFSVAKRKWKH